MTFCWPPLVDPRIIVLTDEPAALRGNIVRAMPPSWLPKDPMDEIGRKVDWSRLIGNASIQQVYVSLQNDPALLLTSYRFDDAIVTLMFAGGTNGLTASVLMLVSLSDRRRITRAVQLPVVSQFNQS